nr:uncharacterized protein si:ch211-79h18.2 [Danio rerio]|eukprot:XP_009303290.1 uncharacterized protein si:ch211-79h18.2 [Danio rerio]
METSSRASSPSTVRSRSSQRELEACSSASSSRADGRLLRLPASEGVESMEGLRGQNDVPPLCPEYDELAEVLANVTAKYNINWEVERQEVRKKAGLCDERILPSRDMPLRGGLPFNKDLQKEIDSGSRKEDQTGPSHHSQTVPEAVGSTSGSLQHNPIGSATHETITVVAQNQGVFPKGKSVPHNQSIEALPTSVIDMEKALVSVPGPYTRSNISAPGSDIRCLTQGLGRDPEGPSRIGTVEGPSSPHAYQLLGDVSSVSGSKALLPSSERSPCVSEDRQHIGGLLHQPSRGFEFAPSVQVGESNPSVGSGEAALSEGSLHPRSDECGSGPPVETGVGAWGMATTPKSGGGHLAEIRQSRRRSICLSENNTLPIVVLPNTSSTFGAGCHGADVAEASSVRFSPNRSAPGSPGEGPSRGGTTYCW